MRAAVQDRQVRVLYVGGIGRSGSTLIERIIGQLPGVCPVGELVHLSERGIGGDERCSCGQPFHQCPFWQQVGAAAFGDWDKVDVHRIAALRSRVDRNRFIPALAKRELHSGLSRDLDEYTSYYARLYTAISQVSGCQLVVDSSKHPSLAHCLRRRADIDLRVLHLIRDSRAVAYSWSRHVRRPDTDSESYMWKYSPAMAAGQWIAQNAAFHLLDRLGCPTMRLKYEDFITGPEPAMRIVTAFAGLPAQASYPFLGADGASHWVQLDGAHSVSGNPMRFATGKIPISQDERWRTSMPKAQQRAVTALTFPLLAGYGYIGAKS
jgi:hypothetical protein